MRKFLPILIFFILINGGCQPAEKQNNITKEAVPVKVSKVQLRQISETLDYVGDIKAFDEALIYPKVTGKIIEKVKEDGSPIQKGEALAYIDRDEVGLKFEKAPVESTLTGIVGRFLVEVGENVNQQTAVAFVVNMDKVKINLDIPEKYLPQITLDEEAEIRVDAYPEDKFTGKVTKISPVVNLDTRSAPIEITVNNTDHRLNSGMFAKVSLIISRHQNVPVILKEAIIGKDSTATVFVVEGSTSRLRKISLGIRQGPYFEVKDGLKQGDLVVIMGQQKLFDGAQVLMEE